MTSGRKGYIIDKYTRDNNLAQAAADAGITETRDSLHNDRVFPADGGTPHFQSPEPRIRRDLGRLRR